MSTRFLCSLLLMAAAACYSDRTVGVSKGDKLDEPAPAKEKFRSRIVAGSGGQSVVFTMPRAGDIDGDGFDDFVIWLQQPNRDPNKRVLLLFYGRAEFPPELSIVHADAEFHMDLGDQSGPVGDLNGDGLDDLMLMRTNSVEFVFGSKRRLQGLIAPNSAGPVWTAGELPPPFPAGFVTQFFAMPAGDLDGDGCADLIVSATAIVNPEPDGTGGGLLMRPYLIRGHRGKWESGVWNPGWAAAGFGFDAGRLDGSRLFEPRMQSLIFPTRAGDLDGDGRGELLASTAVGSLLFYGRGEYPSEVTSRDADARLLFTPNIEQEIVLDAQPWLLGEAGDLDGDGMDDLAVVDANSGEVGFVYGQRWSGEMPLAPEFKVELELPGLQSVQNVATGDINGDGLPELLLTIMGLGSSIEFDSRGNPIASPQSVTAIYVLRGTGQRLLGTHKLSQDDRWQPRDVLLPSGPEAQIELSMAGDIDGDGSQDVLTNVLTTNGTARPDLQMYLIPSTPRSPD